VYSPSTIGHHQGNGLTQVDLSLDFMDAGGDLASFHIAGYPGSDQVSSIIGAGGITSGSLSGSASVSSETLGHYPFEIWVGDATGALSNRLAGSLDVVTDDSGTLWEAERVPVAYQSPDYFRAVAWSGARFAAVGISGSILISPDGITWSEPLNPFLVTDNLTSVLWSGTQFVASGPGSLLTSPDGRTWTSWLGIPSNPSGVSVDGLAWSGSEFVAVGWLNGATTTTAPSALAMVSADGTAWTPVVTSIPARWHDVVWTGSEFMAVGEIPQLVFPGPPARAAVAFSPDGHAWTASASTSLDPLPAFTRLAWNGSFFVALGSTGVYTSPDGETWQSVTALSTLSFQAVAWSGNRFLIAGDGQVYTSTTGSTWVPAGVPGSAIYGLTWANDRWIAVGPGMQASP
jgi:hypothetical protein